MSTITLEQIKAEADALAAKIAIFESQAATTQAFILPETTIELRPGWSISRIQTYE